MTNGEKLRAWRERAGLSQDKAARRVGTSQRTWGAWEANGTTPEIDYADAIEKLTGGAVQMRDWVKSRRKKRREEAISTETPSGSALVADLEDDAAHERAG